MVWLCAFWPWKGVYIRDGGGKVNLNGVVGLFAYPKTHSSWFLAGAISFLHRVVLWQF